MSSPHFGAGFLLGAISDAFEKSGKRGLLVFEDMHTTVDLVRNQWQFQPTFGFIAGFYLQICVLKLFA